MLNVCVTHFGNTYSTKYLDNLEAGIARNYTSDFNFHVKTNCTYRHWDKISFFTCTERTIVLDIDQVVCDNLDELFDYPVDGFGAFKRWWRGNFDINGGFYILEPSEDNFRLAESFYKNPEMIIKQYSETIGVKWKGEQHFVDNNILEKTYLPSEWLGVYVDNVSHHGVKQNQQHFNDIYYDHFKKNMLDNVKLLHFIYDNKIEDHDQWIQDLWNGMSYA